MCRGSASAVIRCERRCFGRQRRMRFSSVEPWLPLSENWLYINAERQSASPCSLLSLYHELIALRQREPAFWEARMLRLPRQIRF